ncbi:helix-turn-helix domain-containing protein [Desulfovibrio sp. OttesenSCG-928-G15]|nr:helix-turn-helix domain-containing protein [Desulfovibrio sp. OttesenSCG-928-G15]
MLDQKSFQARLERIYKATGVSADSALARILGIKAPSVAAARKREQIPSGWIEKIAESYDVSADWLFFGGDEAKGEQQNKGRQESKLESISTSSAEIVLIPMVEAQLSAGHGSFEVDGDSERKYAFRYDFLKRKGDMTKMVLMRVAGDSMSPSIEDGDVVLIDQGQDKPIPGKIYAVGVEDMVYLKVIDALPGKLILKSINDLYQPLEVDTRDQLESQVRIIGRAIWSSREY